jgi:hypothetical protein
MWKAMLEYLGSSIGVIKSSKGVVIPSVLDGKNNLGECSDVSALVVALTPLVPEGFRVTLLEPSFKYPKPAIFVGPDIVRDTSKQNQDAFSKM